MRYLDYENYQEDLELNRLQLPEMKIIITPIINSLDFCFQSEQSVVDSCSCQEQLEMLVKLTSICFKVSEKG